MHSLDQVKKQSWFTWLLRGLLVFGCFILVSRMVELQVVKGEYFRQLANGNRIRRIPISAPRGQILARGGEALVSNSKIMERVQFKKEGGYDKIRDITNAKPEEIISEPVRSYPLGAGFAHVSGYLGQVNEEEEGKVDPNCVAKGERQGGSVIGRDGLEQEYDCLLRGIDGEELIEVDALGRFVRVLGQKTPVAGSDVHTTIDFGIQKKMATLMGGKKGAIVISNGQGQILGLFSSPSFDPTNIAASLGDEDLPFFDRAVNGTFHPGSVFKIVTSIAGLEDGKIDREFTYNDQGVITIGSFSYSNWYFSQYGRTEGEISLIKGIARSTDTMFYKLGEMIGVDRLAFWARQFGLGKAMGIDLPAEASGIVPDPKWKNAVKGEQWFLGNTYHMAIGQGDLTSTPLQANIVTAVIANGGKLCKPYLNMNSETNEQDCKNLNLKKENLDLVKEGMIGACSEGGTAYPFFGFKPQVACKTGTAETGEKDTTHAWFSAFAPADNPQIVVTVLVEKGGEGSAVAAPIAKDILTFWNLRNNP